MGDGFSASEKGVTSYEKGTEIRIGPDPKLVHTLEEWLAQYISDWEDAAHGGLQDFLHDLQGTDVVNWGQFAARVLTGGGVLLATLATGSSALIAVGGFAAGGIVSLPSHAVVDAESFREYGEEAIEGVAERLRSSSATIAATLASKIERGVSVVSKEGVFKPVRWWTPARAKRELLHMMLSSGEFITGGSVPQMHKRKIRAAIELSLLLTFAERGQSRLLLGGRYPPVRFDLIYKIENMLDRASGKLKPMKSWRPSLIDAFLTAIKLPNYSRRLKTLLRVLGWQLNLRDYGIPCLVVGHMAGVGKVQFETYSDVQVRVMKEPWEIILSIRDNKRPVWNIIEMSWESEDQKKELHSAAQDAMGVALAWLTDQEVFLTVLLGKLWEPDDGKSPEIGYA